MVKNTKNNLIIGTALATSIAGSLAALFWRRTQSLSLTNRTREMAARLVYKVRKLRNKTNKNFIIGTLAGSVLAALTAILMTPKSGKKLISDLSKSLNLNQFEKVKKTTRPSRRKREDQAMIRHAVAAKQVVRKKVDKGIKTVKSKVNKHIHHHN